MTQEPNIFPYIARLLQGAEVVWKPLGEVCKVVTDFTASGSFASNAKNIKYLKEPDYALLVRTTDLKRIFKNSENFIYVDKHAFEYLWRVNLDMESIILPNVGNCGEVYYSTPQILPYENCVLGPNAILLRSDEVNNKYLYYLFQGNDFQRDLSKITSSTGQTKFNKTNLKQIQIPLPPLSVQQEIVRILDKFTELDCRKRQYEYYRNHLLSYEENKVEWKALGEVGTFIRGNGLQKKDFVETGIGCIHYGQIYTYYGIKASETISYVTEDLAKSLRKASHNDLIIAGVSENIEDVCKCVVWEGEEDICVSGDTFIFKTDQNPHYIGHLLRTDNFLNYKRKNAIGAKVTRLQAGSLPKYTIPLPPLEEQQRIANILDKFDTLVNSISEGLPREIALRRKQYEYYREQLLSFPKG